MNEAGDPEGGQRALSGRAEGATLRIFLGMAAGVGKTYAMLREAQAARLRGLDLAVLWVEPHGRAETDALLAGLERLPPLDLRYKGLAVREMDLDAALRRRPAIAIVDELAHSNTPGLRHAKRYEDILELLEAGIEVWTTVNIQHLESLADSVELLTLVPVRERVPDAVFDRADEVQLVDLPPDGLLRRLAEGKVYTAGASKAAVANFFQPSTLSALRELALRQASLLASHQTTEALLRSRPESEAAHLGAKTVLVAVGSSPHGENLLRWARRLAYSLKAELCCVHVETGERPSEEDRSRLTENLRLARDLGAELVSLTARDPVEGIVAQARVSEAFAIVVGKSGLGSPRRLFARPSLTERIIAESGTIPVFAVQEKTLREPFRRIVAKRLEKTRLWHYGASLGAVALATGLNLLIAGPVGYWAASVIYLTTITLLGMALDRRAVLAATLASAFLWDFLFIPPSYTLFIRRPEDLLMLGLYFVIALVTGYLTGRLKSNVRLLAIREARLKVMGDLASALAGTSGLEAIIAKGTEALGRAFDAGVLFLLDEGGGKLSLEPRPGAPPLGEGESSAAAYAFAKGQAAGRGTRSLPLIAWRFVPLEAPKGRVGVLGIRLKEGRAWTDDLEDWLSTMARTVSIAVERELLAARAAAADLARESERLGSLLLDSVSHELRTPLAVIQGSASALAEEETDRDEVARRALVAEIGRGARRLDGLVEDLLSMRRLESGSLGLRLGVCDPVELVSAALAKTSEELGDRSLTVETPPEPRPLVCDQGLIVQVLVNLLRNCAAHSGADSPIRVALSQDGETSSFLVRDGGPGVPETELPRLFEKFYRAVPSRPGGTGLGLSICRGIVAAHGGNIAARNAPGGGLEVRFSLPLEGPGREGGGT